MKIYRYSEWDGSQHTSILNNDELTNQLAHGMIQDGDLSLVLWKMQQQELRGSP
jgi:hypothetical protein